MAAAPEVWQTSWEAFVKRVGELHDDGLGNAEISTFFRNATFRWTGTITVIALDEKVSPGVILEMPRQVLRLREGGVLSAYHLPANVSADTAASWRGSRPGDMATFEARLAADAGPFAAIEVDDGLLMMNVQDARRV